LACGTHPGIISDMQPFYVLLGLAAKGRSLVIDYRYPDRTAYLNELNKFLKVHVNYSSGKIEIYGQSLFMPAVAQSTDLRGSMAVIMAALLAKGNIESQIKKPELALRGYNKLLEKLTLLGINYNCVIEQ
jgi:UDP-N-acetylglucosamine 1-carboxyvinyltransferase